MENKSKKYNKEKINFDIFNIFYSLFIVYILGFTFIGKMLENNIIKEYNLKNITLITLFSINYFIILGFFPTFYSEYILEKRYGLTNNDFVKWFLKYLKEICLFYIVGFPLIILLYYFVSKTGKDWWIYTFVFLMVFNIFIGIIAPVLIFPIFYKFEKIENTEIKESIKNIADKTGIKIEDVYKFNMSKDTKKANAALTGIGKTKRIILSDTLIENFDKEEIVAVFAHEAGHLKRKHILKIILINVVVLFFIFYGLSYLKFEKSINGDVVFMNIFKILFLIMLIQNFLMIFQNYLSRKYEKEADLYSKKIMGTEKYLISALKKLEIQNMADDNPNKIIEILFYSHPSIKKRIEYLLEL